MRLISAVSGVQIPPPPFLHDFAPVTRARRCPAATTRGAVPSGLPGVGPETGTIAAGDRVLAACSGGPDSVALVALLLKLREEMPLEIHLAHFNHRLRDGADEDERFVRDLARRWVLPLAVGVGRRQVPRGQEKAQPRRSRARPSLRLPAAGRGRRSDEDRDGSYDDRPGRDRPHAPDARDGPLRPGRDRRRRRRQALSGRPAAPRDRRPGPPRLARGRRHSLPRGPVEPRPPLPPQPHPGRAPAGTRRRYEPRIVAHLARLAAIAGEEDELLGAFVRELADEFIVRKGRDASLDLKTLPLLLPALARRVAREFLREIAGRSARYLLRRRGIAPLSRRRKGAAAPQRDSSFAVKGAVSGGKRGGCRQAYEADLGRPRRGRRRRRGDDPPGDASESGYGPGVLSRTTTGPAPTLTPATLDFPLGHGTGGRATSTGPSAPRAGRSSRRSSGPRASRPRAATVCPCSFPAARSSGRRGFPSPRTQGHGGDGSVFSIRPRKSRPRRRAPPGRGLEPRGSSRPGRSSSPRSGRRRPPGRGTSRRAGRTGDFLPGGG